MNRNKIVEMPDREALKTRYARINWNAHLVLVAREVVADFCRTAWAKGHPLPQAVLRSEFADRGEIAGDTSAANGDSLTIQFGVSPSGICSVAPAGFGRPVIAAGTAALVFAQAPSGAVTVFLYPAGAPAAEPRRIGDYRDPSELTGARIRRLVRSLFDLHRNESPRPTAAVAYSRRQFGAEIAAGTGKA